MVINVLDCGYLVGRFSVIIYGRFCGVHRGFKRFAYDICNVAIEAFHAKSIPERVAVAFSSGGPSSAP